MTKVIKILGRTFGVFFEWMLIFVILFAFLIRTSSFQSYLAKQATDFFSKEWKTKVHIGKVDLTLFNRVYLQDVLIHDLSDKRLLSIRSLEVLVEDFGAQHLTINELVLDKGEVWVYEAKPNNSHWLATRHPPWLKSSASVRLLLRSSHDRQRIQPRSLGCPTSSPLLNPSSLVISLHSSMRSQIRTPRNL